MIWTPSGLVTIQSIPILSDFNNQMNNSGLIGNNTFILLEVTLALIFAIFAASWDILSGYTGQFNFGHALFFGITAYISYIIEKASIILAGNNKINPITQLFLEFSKLLDFHYSITIPFINYIIILDPTYPVNAFFISAFISALLALVIGIIALRLKGPYFALVSLILPIIVYYALTTSALLLLPPGSAISIPNPPRIIPNTSTNNSNFQQINALNMYYVTLVIFFITMGVLFIIAYSRLGDIFQAIREDEEAAESVGINIAKYKIFSFMVSAFFAGLAGNLFAQYQNSISPSLLSTDNSFSVIIMVVVGGIGTIYGGALGAILITLLINLFVFNVFQIPGSNYVIYGLFLLLTALYLPHGIARAKSEQKRALLLGILIAMFWIVITHVNFISNLTSINYSLLFTNPVQFFSGPFLFNLILAFIAIIIIPFIPFFIIAEQIGLFILNNILLFGISTDPVRTVRAMFLIDLVVAIPLTYYFPKIFKKIRLRFFGIWPSIGLYEPE